MSLLWLVKIQKSGFKPEAILKNKSNLSEKNASYKISIDMSKNTALNSKVPLWN